MRSGRARHRQRPFFVFDSVVGFVFDGVARFALVHIDIESAALDDKARNDAMKNQAVVMAVARVLNEIGDGFGRAIGEKADLNVAQIGLQNRAGGGLLGRSAAPAAPPAPAGVKAAQAKASEARRKWFRLIGVPP